MARVRWDRVIPFGSCVLVWVLALWAELRMLSGG
jgi:hypothetical protein